MALVGAGGLAATNPGFLFNAFNDRSMFSDTLMTALQDPVNYGGLQSLQGQYDGKKIVFKRFADWAIANPNIFATIIEKWQIEVDEWLMSKFPEIITEADHVLQNITEGPTIIPSQTSRKAPNRVVYTTMKRVRDHFTYGGLGFEMDYHHLMVAGKGNDDIWSEFDSKLYMVNRAAVMTRIHIIMRSFIRTPHLHSGPDRTFAYTQMPRTVAEVLAIRKGNWGRFNKDPNAVMDVVRKLNKVFARDSNVVDGLIMNSHEVNAAMFNSDDIIRYSQVGPNSLLSDKSTLPTLVGNDVQIYRLPYTMSQQHESIDNLPLQSNTNCGSLVIYTDYYTQLQSWEYKSHMRKVHYYSDTAAKIDEHDLFDSFPHGGHFDTRTPTGEINHQLKYAFRRPEVIDELHRFTRVEKSPSSLAKYDVLANYGRHYTNAHPNVATTPDATHRPVFTIGELSTKVCKDKYIENVVRDCLYALRKDGYDPSTAVNALFAYNFAVAGAAAVHTGTRLQYHFDAVQEQWVDLSVGTRGVDGTPAGGTSKQFAGNRTFVNGSFRNLVNALALDGSVTELLGRLAEIFPWMKPSYGFTPQELIYMLCVYDIDPDMYKDNGAPGVIGAVFAALVAGDTDAALHARIRTANDGIAAPAARLNNLQLHNAQYPLSKSLDFRRRILAAHTRFTDGLELMVRRAVLFTPINLEWFEKCRQHNIRLLFGFADFRPWEQQRMDHVIGVAKGQLGNSYRNERKTFVSFATNTQQITFDNYERNGASISKRDNFEYFRNVKGGPRRGGKGDLYISDTSTFNRDDENTKRMLQESLGHGDKLQRHCILGAMTSQNFAAKMRYPVHLPVDGKFSLHQFPGCFNDTREFDEIKDKEMYSGCMFLCFYYRLNESPFFFQRPVPRHEDLNHYMITQLEYLNTVCSQINSRHFDIDANDFTLERVSHHMWGTQDENSMNLEQSLQ